MYVGASTANFYPMLTEESLDLLIKEGFENLEVFINTQSEASPEFAAELRKRADRAGAVSAPCIHICPEQNLTCYFPRIIAGFRTDCCYTGKFFRRQR